MRESVVVSNRGQITLPAKIRKRLGIRAGGLILLEERGEEVVLRPAAVVEVETYSDQQIAKWDEADRLSETERTAIVKKVTGGR
jgi:AbrB family looped-hinge helix DNA binding protein